MTRGSWPILLTFALGCWASNDEPVRQNVPTEPTSIRADGLDNVFRLSDRLYSGNSPEGDEGFASLEQLGVKTIISVDGAKPDVDTAEKHGMRYVHLPVGYDGISRERATQLAKAVRDLPGPVYIHCHHGKHRGPAACAVVQLTLDPTWTAEDASRWLLVAGTDRKYTGLMEIPHRFKKPTLDELSNTPEDFPPVAETGGMVKTMVEIDSHWDRLKLMKAAAWKTPADHPDLDPSHEALLLKELYLEALRLDDGSAHDEPFQTMLRESATAAGELEAAIRVRDLPSMERAFARTQELCGSCHEKYRNHK